MATHGTDHRLPFVGFIIGYRAYNWNRSLANNNVFLNYDSIQNLGFPVIAEFKKYNSVIIIETAILFNPNLSLH